MSTKAFINSLKFSDHSTISFREDDIVVFVGPNNAGKSASLKEIESLVQTKNFANKKVIKEIEYNLYGDQENLLNFLEQFSMIHFENTQKYYRGFGYSIYAPNIGYTWNSGTTNGLGDLSKVFVNLLSTENRLQAANPAPNISLTKEASSHPIHFLQRDDTIEKQFCSYFKQAFGQELVVHRNAGNNVPLYIGKKPDLQAGEDRVSLGYLQKLELLPLLHEQGDGMRAFVGVLLNAFIANHSILLIDEPEAFLHPPQTRLLGKMLGRDLPKDRQLFLSTHSEHFLKGLLDSNRLVAVL